MRRRIVHEGTAEKMGLFDAYAEGGVLGEEGVLVIAEAFMGEVSSSENRANRCPFHGPFHPLSDDL